MMRGGNTDSTVVVGDGPIAVAAGRLAHVVGDRDARQVLGAGRAASCGPAALVLVNDATFDDASSTAPVTGASGSPRPTSRPSSATRSAASMVMVGAYAGVTGPRRPATRSSRRCAQSIPSYRTQHIAANERALRAGLGPARRRTRSRRGRPRVLSAEPDDATIKSRGTVTIDVEHVQGLRALHPRVPAGGADDVDAR